MDSGHKSVITCDLEGRIETFNEDAERIFGWSAGEVIGRKRVSLFSPGLVVLEHVGKWLATAVAEGRFETKTVFVRRDGTRFAATIRITPTKKNGQHIGYCGVTEPLPDVAPDDAMPPISLATRIFAWLVVTRAPFLTATLVPVLVGAAWAAFRQPGDFPWGVFGLVAAGAIVMHVAANTFNDYFDWTSGTDQENSDYFMPFSGGSRSIELGLISVKGLFRLAVGSFVVAALIGAWLVYQRGLPILWFGLAGAFSVYFYTAPPLRLAARKGLGELFVGLNFGPLLVAGTSFALRGTVDWTDFAVGLPVGLLTTAILWVNEFPDAPSDEKTGKHHLVVVLGKERARWGYVGLLIAALGLVIAGVIGGLLPSGALVALLAAPFAIRAGVVMMRHYGDRELIKASAATIQLHLAAGLLLALGIAFDEKVRAWLSA